jgi:hypothetical protein
MRLVSKEIEHEAIVWIVFQTRRAFMRSGNWKILALLPVAMFASSALGGVFLSPSDYPVTLDWLIQQAQDGFFVGGSQGIISSDSDLGFFSALLNNRVATFTNPSGPGTAKLSFLAGEFLSASAPSLVAPPGQQYANSTQVDIGLEYFSQVICQPEARNDFCGPKARLPLFFKGNYALSGTSGYYGAPNQVSAEIGVWQFYSDCAEACTSGPYAGSIEVRPGQILRIDIGAGAYSLNGGLSVASMDPYLYLSPADVADGYSLVFSEFIDNAPPAPVSGSAVPEPASLMLFGTGVLAAALARRRKIRLTMGNPFRR